MPVAGDGLGDGLDEDDGLGLEDGLGDGDAPLTEKLATLEGVAVAPVV